MLCLIFILITTSVPSGCIVQQQQVNPGIGEDTTRSSCLSRLGRLRPHYNKTNKGKQ
jgi:hypothetical protein